MASLIHSLVGALTGHTDTLCTVLADHGFQVEYPLSLSYTHDLNNYWSAACSDLHPECTVSPRNAQEMADVIAALGHTQDQFAVKSGGHSPNLGFSSTQGGVLVVTKNLDQVVYDASTQTAVIGPGQRWEDVQEKLEPTGRAVVGGRLGGVGVGGLLLGGGLSYLSPQYGWAANNILSYLSPQYGWAANNILSYEVVLANGTLVNANAEEHSDLFAALKGGGGNFGVVTAYTVQTHPMDHPVWGGTYVFGGDKTEEMLAALRDFVEYYPDEKASIILTREHATLLNTWIMFLFYDGPSPPAGIFDNFTALNPLDQTKTWSSYADLLKNGDQFILHGSRYSIAGETIPVPHDMSPTVLQSLFDFWLDVNNEVLLELGMVGTMDFQPLPRSIAQKALQRGGDLLDFPPDQDYIALQITLQWLLSTSDARMLDATRTLFKGFNRLISQHIANGTLPDVYRPLYMNDIHADQDYWGRLRTRDRALQTRRKYDPTGFFQTRTSGFRLS
ncbi:uncharacterized protein ACLA_076270 [Aspergillus clavatus NRRL 1]|uniref:FAD binding domain protein n=1 Tax=Aspergillus clavatus (strain ATCC 1007 / CBS 513.65 / DSM 816 / NCTC 3887 / NRRL 1 / QM 1276 / 107) TaxID=344612 RepID=A1C866_ASPCL|nr:FAD binding domain protein [Aspergillus clavatus NRRL 1]EAW14587.1 FAD binding domain protein [Aspergillus clavatus NRRL 1]